MTAPPGFDAFFLQPEGPEAPAGPESGAARRYLALPDASSPLLLVDVSSRAAAAAAVLRWGDINGPRDLAKYTALAGAVLVGRLPSGVDIVSITPAGTPAILQALEDHGVGRPEWWCAVLTRGSSRRRGVFFVRLADGRARWAVVKFGRAPGGTEKFDREEAGLSLVAEVGGAAARCAPRSLARFDVDGYPVGVQTAMPGQDCGQLLRGPLPRAVKVRALQRVVSWTIEVARTTSAPPSALAPEWETLRAALSARSAGAAGAARAAPDAAELLPRVAGAVPAVFVHGDLADGNVVVSLRTMHAVDWESARRHGPPLWDLLYFSVNTLPLLDGVAGLEQHLAYLVSLFRGEQGASSALLFRWIRTYVDAVGLDPWLVGPLVALCWLHYAARIGFLPHEAAAADAAWPLMALLSEAWSADPALGSDWSAWRA